MATGITVGTVMRRGVVTAKKSDTAGAAAKVMKRASIGGMPVLDDGKIVGMVTEGDIMRDIVASNKPYDTKVSAIMKHPVRTISPDTDIEDAASLMRDLEIERLPVVSKNRLVGIITMMDLVRIEPAMLEMMKERCSIENIPKEERMLSIAGECENCGNYSTLLRSVEGRLLCEDCRD